MKISTKIIFILFLVWIQSSMGQVGNPSVSSAVVFEDSPVSLETGLPSVGFPLYKMATHSKDIDVSMSLNYHQSNIKKNGRRLGNCGRGWNLSVGGSIQRSPININYYTFTFMGYSGNFEIKPRENGVPGFDVIIFESNGAKLAAEVHQVVWDEFSSFTFYDGKGNRFEFNDVDIIHLQTGKFSYDPKNLSFQLSDIYDSNANVLAHFHYVSTEETVTYKGQLPNTTIVKLNTLNILDKVFIDGYGSIDLSYDTFPDTDGLWIVYNYISVKNIFNEEVKNIYAYAEVGAINNVYDIKLISLSIGTKNYGFEYKPITFVANDQSPYVESEDSFGYRTLNYKYCDTDLVNLMTDKNIVTEGVLEKIYYPDGGCAIYDYEPGTYSFYGVQQRIDLDVTNNVIIPSFFTDLDVSPDNRHNFDITEIVNTVDTPFSVSENTEVYIKAFEVPRSFDFGGDQQGQMYPIFRLVNANNVSQHYGPDFELTSNGENECLGRKVTLSPGITYKLTGGFNGASQKVSVYTMKPKSIIKKWWYGGGIRIKNIAYFTSDVPQNYFHPEPGQTFNITPEKKEFYKYNIFGDESLSSGIYGGSYTNITVSEAISNSRTEYTFKDTPQGLKIKNQKIFNYQNILLQESSFDYFSVLPDPSNLAKGWALIKESITKEYLGNTLEKTNTFEYDSNRRITGKTSTTSRLGDILETFFYYHLDVNGNPYSFNRFGEIDHIDEFVGSRQISTTKMEYNNNWRNSQGTIVNTAYQASKISKSKGSGSPVLQIKNNVYDLYGNILETEDISGLKKCYVFGYNNTVVIAEITGIAYVSLPTALIDAAKNASNVNDEASLLTALANLRAASQLSTALITTYTYKPLKGISTVTDPRGYKMIYEYDAFGRQIAVKDEIGNLITDTMYHNKFQN